MKRRLAVITAWAMFSGLVLSGCGLLNEIAESPSPSRPDRAVPEGWDKCTVAEGAECSTFEVPLDWEDPGGAKIELALARVPASNEDLRIGSLLVNPGGPGGSGKSFLGHAMSVISPEVAERYDIVGFDPRGVGESTPVTCYTQAAELDEHYAADWPRTPEGYEASLSIVEPFAKACEENSGPVLAYVDTVSSAKDMEAMREWLGDDKLNLLGYSYGTFLGATYADLYPERVGRFVLDGALDPSVSADVHEVEQAAGFEAALGAYLDDCLGQIECPFAGTKEEAKAELHQFLTDVAAKPLKLGSGKGRTLTLPLAMNGIIVAMYDEATWSAESMALSQALRDGNGTWLMVLSDAYLEREMGEYTSNMMEAFVAINCLDDRAPADLASAQAHAAALAEASPTLGEFWAYGEKQCEVWPYPQTGKPHVISAPGADPILVIGTTGDPATPYHGAVALAEQLESGVLLTYEGNGHTAYGRSNECVQEAVDAYLLGGKAPRDGLTC
ncbi:MAG: alpha/beta hydrolase [Bifidobacteriaceae bacterium]|jgi:pimeloyl-ACP methyl ester carboxylesterase|nr:alpha/beta hydrolase [Bifidobacteriaceae bacterium]